MSDLAVFVDGPLRGGTHVVVPWQQRAGWVWRTARKQEPLSLTESPAGWKPPPLEFEDVLYRFRLFEMFGRAVLVGSVADPPSPEDCFGVLCSDAAQRSALHGMARPGAG